MSNATDVIVWTTAAVNDSHVHSGELEALMLGKAPSITRALADGESTMLRVPEVEDLDDVAGDEAQAWCTVLDLLRWAAGAGYGWVYLDPDAEPVDGLARYL